MELSEDMASPRAELDRLVEAALTELATYEALGDGADAWLSDLTVSDVLRAAERLREVTKVERLEAPSLAARLERHPETRARLLIDNQAGFQTWGLCEELLGRSRKAIFEGEPQRAVRLSRLAVSVAERLDDDLYSGGLADDMRARAWGSLGNAFRCSSQFDAAAAAFVEADDLLDLGSGDPLEQANLYSLRASLAHWIGDLDETVRILDRAEAIYSELDEHTLRGKILIQKANAAGFQDAELGVECAQAAEKAIDAKLDERLFLLARHAHIFWLVEAGQPERAKMLLDASRHIYRRHGDTWFTIRLAGVESRILFAFGAVEEAEAGLRVVLDEFSERELYLDTLICALDIAACRLALGDPEGAADIAAAMVPHLRECKAHNHAREAWALFRHSLSIHRASQELVREVRTYLQLAWKNPRLRFSSRLTAGSGPV